MKGNIFFIAILLISLSGCTTPSYQTDHPPVQEPPSITAPAKILPSTAPVAVTPVPVKYEKSDLLIDRISENLSTFYDRKWNTLYLADELDCSRMSTYFWDYIRTNYKVAPKIVISYERQHAWLALRVSDVGNSTKYIRWNINGIEYYYVESTIPTVVAQDYMRFVVNDREYTSAEFYNASIFLLDTPQDANDFQADRSALGGWNQEFRLKADDLAKIGRLLK